MGTPTAVQLQASCQWTNSHSWWHAWAAHHSWCFIHFRHPGIISDCVKQLDIFWEWFSTGRTSVEMFSMITFLPANCVEICKTTSALKMMHIYDVTMWQVLDSVLLPHTVNQFLKKREPIGEPICWNSFSSCCCGNFSMASWDGQATCQYSTLTFSADQTSTFCYQNPTAKGSRPICTPAPLI